MNFNLNNYLGTWYEIARIKNDYEIYLKNVKTEYTLNDDGTIKVVNSGYFGNEYKESIGIATKTDDDMILKISFDSINFNDYKILYIDENYQYALVGGDEPHYLWILSRTEKLEEKKLVQLLDLAKEKNYNIGELILVHHN